MLSKVRSTIYSPNRLQRIAHYFYAQGLNHLPRAARRRLFSGDQYACPLCGSKVRKFLVIQRPYHAYCPVCWSLQRHRLVWLYFQRKTDLFDKVQKKLLHIAPEPALAEKLMQLPQVNYLSADLYNKSAMIKMDITDIQFAEDTFDIIYCSHVLEHVPDDQKAMRELRRVLKKDGFAVIIVPIVSDVTVEDPTLVDPIERERRFGQIDHVRVYGPDVLERLEGAGFTVTRVTMFDIASRDEMEYFGLNLKDIIFSCTK